jgi:hypothetical protein
VSTDLRRRFDEEATLPIFQLLDLDKVSKYEINPVKKVKQSRYRPGVAQRVPGS